MIFRRYCVTVMDNWTPTRCFWTRKRADEWCDEHRGHLFVWNGREWQKIVDTLTAQQETEP